MTTDTSNNYVHNAFINSWPQKSIPPSNAQHSHIIPKSNKVNLVEKMFSLLKIGRQISLCKKITKAKWGVVVTRVYNDRKSSKAFLTFKYAPYKTEFVSDFFLYSENFFNPTHITCDIKD